MKYQLKDSRRLLHLGLIILSLFLIIASWQSAPVYAEDGSDGGTKFKYTDRFGYTDNSEVQWHCAGVIVSKDGKESYGAVVTGCENATPELVIPAKVKDSAGNNVPVVGVVSAHTVDADHPSYEFSYNEDSENGKYNITNIHFPDSVILIGEDVFASKFDPEDYKDFENPYEYAPFALITSIELPDNADLVIENQAFYHCGEYNGLGTSVQFGSKPITIKSEAFGGCTGIESLTLPAGSTIANNAFEYCSGVKEIKNAPAYLNLGTYFKGDELPKLTTVSFSEGLTEIEGINVGVVTNASSYEDEVDYYEYGLFDSLKNVTIPSTAKTVGGFANMGIEKITLPEGVETISDSAFQGCTKLKSINFPSSLKDVQDCAFKDCVSLNIDVKHPSDSLEYQYYNSGIRSITLRSDLSLCYPGGFTKCPNLQNITIEGSSDKTTGGFKTKNGVLYIGCYDNAGTFTGWLLGKFPAGISGGSYTVPSDVIGLDGFAFEGCKFSEIHIPETCTMELAEYMASLSEGFNGDEIIEFYPLENMASKPDVYVVKDSDADYLYDTCSKYTVKYEAGSAVKPVTPVPDQTKPVNPTPTDTTPTNKTPADTTPSTGETDDYKRQEALEVLEKLLEEQDLDKTEKGTVWTKNGSKYKVLKNVSGSTPGAVILTKAKNVKSFTVPATVKLNNRTFKVTQVGAKAFTGKKIRTVTIGKNVKVLKKNAFKSSKATKIILKTKLLKKANVKGCLKGSKVKKIQVKVGKKADNKKYVKKYKKIFTKKNAGRKVTVK